MNCSFYCLPQLVIPAFRKCVIFNVDFLIFREELSKRNVMRRVVFVIHKESDLIAIQSLRV